MTFFWRILFAPMIFFLATSVVFALPMSKEQLFQLATMAAADHEFERSVELFQKVIEMDPKFAPAYNGLGLLYQTFEEGSLEEAIRYFKLATDIAPDYTESWNNLARAYYAKGRFIEAEQAFLRSLDIVPAQPDVAYALAWNYLLGQSRPEEALAYFEKALLSRTDPVIYYGMGLAHLLKGDKFKVLEAVTVLRRHQHEEQAARLEKMVRENVRLTSTPGKPLVTGLQGQESLFDQQLKALEAGGFVPGKDNTGIKVRLKGPLL